MFRRNNQEPEADNTPLEESGKSEKVATATTIPAGFVIQHDDPYGSAVRRVYVAANPKAQVPGGGEFVLPFNDPAAKVAIENYIVRAEGACDKQRALAAKKALAQFK